MPVLIKDERKTSLLKPPAFGCLKKIPSINITRGCAFSCVYCYAKGFPNAPQAGEVYYYNNLTDILERELERRFKRGNLPPWVTFSTASDPFQPFEETLKLTYQVMERLLRAGVGVSFLTKGYIPDEFITLFSSHPSLVSARIGIVSLNKWYRDMFEPYAPLPEERIENVERLIRAGIDTAVRIDPIIPFITDSRKEIYRLIKGLSITGVRETSISYLVMRPFLAGEFLRELPFDIARRILRLYHGQPYRSVITSARTRLLPKGLRERGYRIFKELAVKLSISCHICGCKNPDMGCEFCSPWVERDNLYITDRQMSLF